MTQTQTTAKFKPGDVINIDGRYTRQIDRVEFGLSGWIYRYTQRSRMAGGYDYVTTVDATATLVS
jgi:hypothetical protein